MTGHIPSFYAVGGGGRPRMHVQYAYIMVVAEQ